MAAPVKVFARKARVNFNTQQIKRIEREASLSNRSFSEVVRECVDLHFGLTKKRRKP
jgi:hypothetical protein